MRKITESHVFTGIQRDLSVSKHPVQFLYDGRNIRLTAREGGDTLLSITNEKGTVAATGDNNTQIAIKGSYLGHCLLNQYLVVFSTLTDNVGQWDFITRIDLREMKDVWVYDSKYSVPLTDPSRSPENLGFSLDHPIEAIPSYETEEIQKVYWTDGYNQPRVANIIGKIESDTETFSYNSKSFDFVRELQLEETITVKKLVGASGMFAPGVIQYAFTYYTKYGQESNIFYTTPLYYISPKDRGAAPDEKVDNAFKITVTGVDRNFDYLRIYSIQRTSINSTPICKRIQDIAIDGLSTVSQTDLLQASYIDTGISGNSVDPTELLYKGGEEITAGTIEQKDGTLFLGDVKIKRDSLASIKNNPAYYDSHNHKLIEGVIGAPGAYTLSDNSDTYVRYLCFPINTTEGYEYGSQLTGYADSIYSTSVPCGGFKRGETYRCGVQFQHKSGKWSDPFWAKDFTKTNNNFSYSSGVLTIPCIRGTISSSLSITLRTLGYRKVRAVVCFPNYQDRTILCQGVLNPTVYTVNGRYNNKSMLAQSSWFFRPFKPSSGIPYFRGGDVASPNNESVPYTTFTSNYDPNTSEYDPNTAYSRDETIRQVEIQGSYDGFDAFSVDGSVMTFHSPDIEFDEAFYNISFENTGFIQCNNAKFTHTLSDISIQTETPTASNAGSGFIHKSFNDASSRGIIAGLFYDDFCLDDDVDKNIVPYEKEYSSYKWMVYPWHRSGSLTNDVNRPSNLGVQSSLLKKKVISNLRYSEPSTSILERVLTNFSFTPKIFSSNEVSVIKVDNDIHSAGSYPTYASNIYQGNIDTMLNPDKYYPLFFAFDGNAYNQKGTPTDFSTDILWKIWAQINTDSGGQSIYDQGIYHFDTSTSRWSYISNTEIGDAFQGLAIFKDSVRMRYKSSPHLVCYYSGGITSSEADHFSLPVVDIVKQSVTNRFGGETLDALMENNWVPCGEPVTLDGGGTTFYYSYGDTYFQRYDCLKTYAFSPEDENQVVEIGSFMLETYMNIDGRYDRNRGQMNNTNMSPRNFNLMNPVYSQIDNFFSYKILPDDYYSNTQFPNQITWTKEKQSGADVDKWTNITLASTYDMDGSKGKVEEITTWKDQIYCFQHKGVSNILFNSRVQIPASDGLPIEISNSYKVDGYRYISDGIGCDNKQLVMDTPQGIYFIDSVGNHLFHIGDGGISDISQKNNMSTLFKREEGNWKKLLYDNVNHDLYLMKDTESLCYSETLGQFTGWMDYGGMPVMESCDGHVFVLGVSAAPLSEEIIDENEEETEDDSDVQDGGEMKLWKMFEGSYNQFFDKNYGWGFTFVSNGINDGMVSVDKTFTNLEFRASVVGDGELNQEAGKFTPSRPFDSLEVWDEYQHGKTQLHYNGMPEKHFREDSNALKRKFRIWRCDIPRDNVAIPPLSGEGMDESSEDLQAAYNTFMSSEAEKGIYRYKAHPNDRMRNPWLFLEMKKGAADSGVLPKTEVHDIMVTYFV